MGDGGVGGGWWGGWGMVGWVVMKMELLLRG